MRCKYLLTSIVLALASGLGLPAPACAQVFGSVTAIGGSASDIALDETRGLLYVANFGASLIDVMSITDGSIHSSINVAPQPGALAISKDAQYLLIAHYANGNATPQGSNLITLIHLADNSIQTFNTGDSPLGVAFLGNDMALIITTTSILSFSPVSGQTAVLSTFANLANTLPVSQGTFPSQILQAALTTSGDGNTVWGIAGAGTSSQVIYRYSAATSSIYATVYVSSPALLPRLSVSYDGSYAMVGYTLIGINSLNPF